MKQELEQRAQEALLAMLDGVQKAADFTVEQAPLVVKELLMWKFVYSLGLSLVFVLLAVVSSYITYRFFAWGLQVEDEYRCRLRIYKRDLEPIAICLSMLTAGFVIAGFSVALHSLDWLQILVAPRLYLLEYAAALVK